jgi:hypothetical protein
MLAESSIVSSKRVQEVPTTHKVQPEFNFQIDYAGNDESDDDEAIE